MSAWTYWNGYFMDYAGSDHPIVLPLQRRRHTRPGRHDRGPTGRRSGPVYRRCGRRTRRELSTIITEVDGVLLTFEPTVLAGIEQRHGLPEGRLRDILVERPVARAASIGVLDQQAWLDQARHSVPAAAIDEWLSYHGVPVQPTIDVLRQARQAGCRIVLLANATRRRHDDLAYHQLGDLADQVLLSAEIGCAKPDPAAWLHALRHGGVDPARSIAIETEPAWAQISAQLGIRAHRFIDAHRLRGALTRAGASL